MEEILKADPDIVILADGGPFATLGTDDLWKGLTAVNNNKYFEIPQGPFSWMSSPPSVNRILGIKWLGNLLYPELFDYDMIKEAKVFYKLFWHYDLTDAEAGKLLANSTYKVLGTN